MKNVIALKWLKRMERIMKISLKFAQIILNTLNGSKDTEYNSL